jgi:hypothetical protein
MPAAAARALLIAAVSLSTPVSPTPLLSHLMRPIISSCTYLPRRWCCSAPLFLCLALLFSEADALFLEVRGVFVRVCRVVFVL